MRAERVLLCTVVMAVVATVADAEPPPPCRVRLVRSAATEVVPAAAAAQVKAWVDASEQGSRLVSTIDDADVVLEFSRYRQTTAPDGTPAEEWWFIARRLSESDRQRATYRFVYTTLLGQKARAQVAGRLRLVLSDVCLGYLPKTAITVVR